MSKISSKTFSLWLFQIISCYFDIFDIVPESRTVSFRAHTLMQLFLNRWANCLLLKWTKNIFIIILPWKNAGKWHTCNIRWCVKVGTFYFSLIFLSKIWTEQVSITGSSQGSGTNWTVLERFNLRQKLYWIKPFQVPTVLTSVEML